MTLSATEKKELLTVYSVQKKKKVLITKNAEIKENPNHTFTLKGETKEGDKVAGILGKEKADKIIKGKLAKKI